MSWFLSPGCLSVEAAMPSTRAVILSLQSLSKCVWEGYIFGERSAVHGLLKKPSMDKKKRKITPKTVTPAKESAPPCRARTPVLPSGSPPLSPSGLSASLLSRAPDGTQCPQGLPWGDTGPVQQDAPAESATGPALRPGRLPAGTGPAGLAPDFREGDLTREQFSSGRLLTSLSCMRAQS